MALQRLTIDISDEGRDAKDRLRYSVRIQSSEDVEWLIENISHGKVETLVNFAVNTAIESLPLPGKNILD